MAHSQVCAFPSDLPADAIEVRQASRRPDIDVLRPLSLLMRMGKWTRRLAVVAWCLCLVECSAPQPAPIHSAFEGVPPMLQIDPQFRAGLDRLTTAQGWPLVTAAASPSASAADLDWLLLGVKTQVNGETRVWFVRVAEVIDPLEAEGGRPLRHRRFEYSIPFGVGAIKAGSDFAIRCRRVLIETYDEHGVFQSSWSRLSPVVFPESTLFRALSTLPTVGPLSVRDDEQASIEAERLLTVEATQALRDESLYGMVAALQAVGTTPPVTPIRDLVKGHVVETPSVLSLLFSGLRPTLQTTLTTAQPLDFPWVFGRVNVPCYEADFATYLAGARFFDCRVIAGPSVPPCDLLGGLLVIEVAHPHKPANRLTVRVLASSRTQPAWSPEDVAGYRSAVAQR